MIPVRPPLSDRSASKKTVSLNPLKQHRGAYPSVVVLQSLFAELASVRT
jgi:hypothetical protein